MIGFMKAYYSMVRITSAVILFINGLPVGSYGQPSVAREWNEVLLEAIRNDLARPTVHARNLFHVSAAMYDAWAAFEPNVKPYFLGNTVGDFYIPFNGIPMGSDKKAFQEEAISFAAYRIIRHRFIASPGWIETYSQSDELMNELGYDAMNNSLEYANGDPAALGNYIASKIIEFGLQDGSNERGGYQNEFYVPVNDPLILTRPGSLGLTDPNRWQPLTFETFIDQSGNEIPTGTPEFLGPEWGKVIPFSMNESDITLYSRDGSDYRVYHDPGPPCFTNEDGTGTHQDYEWGFSLVARWSSHMNAADGATWDISPATIGNIDFNDLPADYETLRSFYDRINGGDISQGHPVNPITGNPYQTQIVPRGDYVRVLSEFWADGPDSETPPGHWFTILNYVNDHPQLQKKLQGEGDVLDDLEWDVKSYFILGGALHDAAISAWSIKGYYDYIRPISAIRHLAELGQSSEKELPNYHPAGIRLEPGFIENVGEEDPLAGDDNEHVGKIKVFAWRGHDVIQDAATDVAGTGWILAENWWPYQRPSFVTPPFAGYVSGHSTFSRTAAKVLTLLTGDQFFPGGMGEFIAEKDSFLRFEKGPSVDVVLQWATYYDASDQCSLSRIWGGIHPPVDDINGRIIGDRIGEEAFQFAAEYFREEAITGIDQSYEPDFSIFPNPIERGSKLMIRIDSERLISKISLLSVSGVQHLDWAKPDIKGNKLSLDLKNLPAGMYVVILDTENGSFSRLIQIH
ncbi:MAG: T9SS type A sorting domain-containing protein [Cyclobacteriaceae bacterium]|nr:T9SS type A sorting domain-containing protein [Cyclobacteriaceae bacterium]